MTTDPAVGAGYFAADAEATDELARLKLIEAECDPHTLRYLDAIGVGAGWRCLEVGAGAGSVVRWLSERVGPQGRVVAADLDLRFLGDLREPNVEVRRCDITRDELDLGFYDLVHCRFLLMHLQDPAGVLRRMTAALRPGGWLVAEDVDNDFVQAIDRAHPLAEAFDSCYRKRIDWGCAAGNFDLRFGKALPVHMNALGLVEMGNEGIARIFRGGDPFSLMWIKTWQRLDDAMLAQGAVTESEVADMRRAYEDPAFMYRAQLTQTVWGRKPPDNTTEPKKVADTLA
jgi:SAM-dependent methyltransferase